MKIAELRQKNPEELKNLLIQKREKLRFLRFGLSSGKIKNVREIRQVKKDIARILTLFGGKQPLSPGENNKKV
jgi:large subunit ribosomal protein L29